MRSEHGFTIVEVMVAVAILLTGVLGTLAMLDTANKRSRTAADRQQATALAREVVEVARGLPYREIAPDTVVARLREDGSIAGESGSPWRIERDGTTFTLEAQACWLDDPGDDLGSRAGGNFCAETGTGGVGDANPVDFKRVTIVVSWSNPTGRGSVRQAALVGARGAGDAPAVSSVRMTSPVASPITSSATQSASFAVTTAADAASVVWSVDGSAEGAATGGGRNWTFTWQLPAQDGTYLVAAQALETNGLSSEAFPVTVVVNRFVPVAPVGVVAGRNGTMVEVEWSANRERDVIGYRVYRQARAGSATVACQFTTKTSCIDLSAPARVGTELEYWVVALDNAPSGGQREGAASARVNVNVMNRPPNAPTALTLARDGQGNAVLTWTAPNTADPDSGDSIVWYRIYRGGTAVANRHDRVSGSERTAVDGSTGGASHSYWVTAVDSHLAESAPIGPVTG